MLLICLIFHIFHAVVFKIKVLLLTTAQSNFLLPCVSATYCSHHQGAVILPIHKLYCVLADVLIICMFFDMNNFSDTAH
jgi:hypothetical protein